MTKNSQPVKHILVWEFFPNYPLKLYHYFNINQDLCLHPLFLTDIAILMSHLRHQILLSYTM